MADKIRCWWTGDGDALYLSYHDREWGVPEYDPRALYEKLVLDGFQAGLSWITILRKRENFRKAFHNFDPEKIARYGRRDVEPRLANEERMAGNLQGPHSEGEHGFGGWQRGGGQVPAGPCERPD